MTDRAAEERTGELEELVDPDRKRDAFDQFAEATARFASKSSFFTLSLIFTVVWIPTVFLFESVDTWQLVYNTAVSALAFILIALLQNSERRYDLALHHKIDALANGLADLMENLDEKDPERVRRDVERLRASVKLERRI